MSGPQPGTPLPWESREKMRRQGVFGDVGGTFLAPAGCEDPFDRDTIARFYTRDGMNEREQNAAYAAHACNTFPDLLEALESILENAVEDDFGNQLVRHVDFTALDALVAKARGQS